MNANIENRNPSTAEDLFAELNGFADWPTYIFRGQADSTWLLESTLSRILKTLTYPNKVEIVENHLKEFKLQIRGRRGQHPRELHGDDLWALGQHYGLHTPLLDWSYSPYVALFFSLVDRKQAKDGKRTVWAFNRIDSDALNKFHASKTDFETNWKVDLIEPILDENGRLVSQRGLFTKLGIQCDLESVVNNGPDIKWITLYKINFPESIRETALDYLELMNINHSSLFPDLFGSAKASNKILEQTDYREQHQEEYWRTEGRKR